MLNIICKNSVKRYIRGVFLLGSCRSCLQLHGNEALPNVSEVLGCSSNTTLQVKEWIGDLVAIFVPNNSRNFRDAAFLSLIDTDQESVVGASGLGAAPARTESRQRGRPWNKAM